MFTLKYCKIFLEIFYLTYRLFRSVLFQYIEDFSFIFLSLIFSLNFLLFDNIIYVINYFKFVKAFSMNFSVIYFGKCKVHLKIMCVLLLLFYKLKWIQMVKNIFMIFCNLICFLPTTAINYWKSSCKAYDNKCHFFSVLLCFCFIF